MPRFTFQVQDDGGTANGGVDLDQSPNTITVNVDPVGGINTPSVLDLAASGAGTGFTTTFTENGAAAPIAAADVLITDAENFLLQSATVVLTNAQAGDSLQAANVAPFGLASNINTAVPGQITVTYSGLATLADYQTVLRQTLFGNASENPATVDRNLTVVVNDGTDNSNAAQAIIHALSVNDAPVITVPGGRSRPRRPQSGDGA